MATESPVRIVETTSAGKWGLVKDPASFRSHNLVEDELSLLLKGHKTHEDHQSMVPNRSGSAPPSIEGSFGNLLYLHTSSWDSALASSSSGPQYYQPEDQLRADSSDYVLSTSKVNLSKTFPQPIMSREGRQQLHSRGATGSNWNLKSSAGSSDLLLTRSSLSTHHEEPEDDISPQKASQDLADSIPSIMSLQVIPSLAGQHRNVVDLIQADFPRTPSPVYNQSHRSSNVATNEPIDAEIGTPTLDNLSLNFTKSPDPKSSADSSIRVGNSYHLNVIDNSSATPVSKTAYLDKVGGMITSHKDVADQKDKYPGKDEVLGSKDSPSHDGNTHENIMREMNSVDQKLHFPHQNFQVQGYQDQVSGQSSSMLADSGKALQSPLNVSLQPPYSGFTPPPLYATAAAYMASGNQYFSNLNPPPLYASQYSMGGYPLGSTFAPPFYAGYPSHGGVPVAFDSRSTQTFSSQTSVDSTAGTNTQGELILYNKFYGHQGLVVHPTFPDPLQMQYFHYPPENSFSHPHQYGSMPPANLVGDQFGSFAPQRDPNMPPNVDDKKFVPYPSASYSTFGPRKVGMPSYTSYGTAAGDGYVPQYPSSPQYPDSPLGAANPSGRRYDSRFPQSFARNTGVYVGWQGPRGSDGFNDSKKHSFLEELKASNARKINLSDIAGRIVEFSVDQHGSRFIQQKLENCSVEEKASVFKEVLPHALKLMSDVFGNYVIQKFFDHGDLEQRKELANKLSGQMLPLSLQMYGCRVIQKALEVIELDQKTKLVHDLDGHVIRCIRDQNGNHVIQKIIECIPTENMDFIISAFRGQVSTLSTHPYGCRVIQRVLEHCSDNVRTQCIVDEILESSYALAQDQYGNYVIQHVLARGKPHERNKIISKLQGKIIQLSQHKYASNVVEKCLEYGDADERESLINEILAQPENDNLLMMMKDQFANYVVQKILEISNDEQHDLLVDRIRLHLHALKKYTYGKHIVAQFEHLSGEEESVEAPDR